MTEKEKRHFKACMAEEGYTIITLAKALGMNRNALARRINGQTDWSQSEMKMVGVDFKTRSGW